MDADAPSSCSPTDSRTLDGDDPARRDWAVPAALAFTTEFTVATTMSHAIDVSADRRMFAVDDAAWGEPSLDEHLRKRAGLATAGAGKLGVWLNSQRSGLNSRWQEVCER